MCDLVISGCWTSLKLSFFLVDLIVGFSMFTLTAWTAAECHLQQRGRREDTNGGGGQGREIMPFSSRVSKEVLSIPLLLADTEDKEKLRINWSTWRLHLEGDKLLGCSKKRSLMNCLCFSVVSRQATGWWCNSSAVSYLDRTNPLSFPVFPWETL